MIKIPEHMVYVQLPGRRLMGVLSRAQDGEAVARYSDDGGYTWSTQRGLFLFPGGMGSWNIENALLGQSGEILLVCHNDANTEGIPFYQRRYDIWVVRSTSGRTKWQKPKFVWKGYSGSLLSVTQLQSGRVVLPFCYLTPRTWANRGTGFEAFTYMGRFSSTAAYSDDDSATWRICPQELKEATPTIGANGGIEPIVIELKDGRLWMLIRTQTGFFFESYSEDGSSWSRPHPTRIITSDSPAGLVRLNDGRILMLWNNCQRFPYANGGRYVLHGAISIDEGKTWRGYREVARTPQRDEPPPRSGDYGVSYTVPTLTSEGEVVTSLSTGPGGDVYILHLDPNWLDANNQREDFQDDLANWTHFGTKGVSLAAPPHESGRHVLELKKPDVDWPAAVVWNFPMGRQGKLRLRIFLRSGFRGALLGLTDQFSVPFDALDRNYNLYNLPIGPEGKLSTNNIIKTNRWHDFSLLWNCSEGKATFRVGEKALAVMRQSRETLGVSYLRIASTAALTDDAGMLVGSAAVDVANELPPEN